MKPLSPPRFLGLFIIVLSLALIEQTDARAAAGKPSAKPPADTEAPVLMSKGDRVPWSNLKELEAYAAKGNTKACAQLGELLLRGDGIPQNVPRAFELLEKAARAGEGTAAFRLGMVLDDGLGVTKDRTRALDYFRAAAAGGVSEGFFNVGAAYVGGHGVKRDYTEGLAWLILAAKRGSGVDTEHTVRDRIQKMRRPEWIAAAEKRAPQIEEELKAKKVAEFLPAPAPFVVTGTVPPLTAVETESGDARFARG